MKRISLCHMYAFIVLTVALGLYSNPRNDQPFSEKRAEYEKLDKELMEKLAEIKKTEIIPVFILFENQANLDDFSLRFEGLKKEERRQKSVVWLKDLSERTFQSFKEWLRGNDLQEKIHFQRRFWLVNGIEAKGLPKAIERMSRWSGIAQVYLRTEKPALMVKKNKNFARLILRGLPAKETFKGPFLTKGKEIPWNLRNIKADSVWAQGYTGRGVVIAILDSGVNYSHPDLRTNLWINSDEVPENDLDDDGNGYTDDLFGWNFAEENQNVGDNFFHGSESAGILVGDGTAGLITGVAPQASLMILKTYAYDKTRQYSGRYLWQAFQYDKWLAFEYALENGAHVASLSFDYQPSEKPLFSPWRYVLTNASNCGLTIVAGAGNSRGWLTTPHQITPPANVPDVIVAGGTDEDSRVDRVSSRGPVTWTALYPFNDYPLPRGLIKPDVCAPVGRHPLIHWSSDGYKYHTQSAGTSLSAPHVAGVVALLLEKDPELTPGEIKNRLEETCLDIGIPGKDNYSGWGLVDALDAINYGLYPKVHLSAVNINDGLDYFIKEDQNFRLDIELRVSSAALNRAEISVFSSHPELRLNETKVLFKPNQPVESGEFFSAEFHGHASAAIKTGKKILCDLFVKPMRGRKFHFHFPLYIGRSDLLVVDDDGEGQNEQFIFEALEKSGRSYHHIDLMVRRKDLEKCLEYKTLIWITGEEFEDTLNKTEQDVLQKFMDAGKNLIILGDNIGDDIGSDDFYKNYLHAEVIKARITGNFWREKPYMIYGKDGDPLSQHLSLPVYTYYKQYDLIRPLAEANDPFLGQDKDNYIGFIRFSGPYKLIYTSLGMESIEDTSIRARLLDRILDWMEK